MQNLNYSVFPGNCQIKHRSIQQFLGGGGGGGILTMNGLLQYIYAIDISLLTILCRYYESICKEFIIGFTIV